MELESALLWYTLSNAVKNKAISVAMQLIGGTFAAMMDNHASVSQVNHCILNTFCTESNKLLWS